MPAGFSFSRLRSGHPDGIPHSPETFVLDVLTTELALSRLYSRQSRQSSTLTPLLALTHWWYTLPSASWQHCPPFHGSLSRHLGGEAHSIQSIRTRVPRRWLLCPPRRQRLHTPRLSQYDGYLLIPASTWATPPRHPDGVAPLWVDSEHLRDTLAHELISSLTSCGHPDYAQANSRLPFGGAHSLVDLPGVLAAELTFQPR